MRIANVNGRLSIVEEQRAYDVEALSGGAFGSDPQTVYPRWPEFTAWASGLSLNGEGNPFTPDQLGAPVPRPAQVFAIGLNYGDHAKESGYDVPEGYPPVFTKFASAIAAPNSTVRLPPGGHTDWEVELVVVVGATARNVESEDAWDHIAGLTIGQDISERVLQLAGPAPQFSLGKSFENFAPIGPWVVTVDEFEKRDDIALRCSINGEVVQDGRTSQLIFSIPELIARLSKVITLNPGDVIFTGTPAGVGMGRTPQRWLQDGDVLESHVEGIGTMTQRFVSEV